MYEENGLPGVREESVRTFVAKGRWIAKQVKESPSAIYTKECASL